MKVKDMNKDQLTGAVRMVIANYELAFGDIDTDYELFTEVVEIGTEKIVLFHFVYEYNSVGESGTIPANAKFTRKKLVLDPNETLKDLLWETEHILKQIINNPIIHK